MEQVEEVQQEHQDQAVQDHPQQETLKINVQSSKLIPTHEFIENLVEEIFRKSTLPPTTPSIR